MEKPDDFDGAAHQGSSSLLWPGPGGADAEGAAFTLDDAAVRDLEADRLFRRIAGDERRYLEMEPVFRKIPRDPAVIRFRQEALDDLLRNPGLAQALERVLPALEAIARNKRGSQENDVGIYRLACKLTELEALVDCVDSLRGAFAGMDGPPRSAAWRELRDLAESYGADPAYARLSAELPGLCHRLRCARSVSLGVNLDVNLMPSSVVLLSVDEDEYPEKNPGMLSFVSKDEEVLPAGIAPLHNLDPKKEFKYFMGAVLDPKEYGYAYDPLMAPLMADLDTVLRKAVNAVRGPVSRYASLSTQPLSRLRRDLLFYLCARKMVLEMRSAGMDFCMPEILEASARSTSIKGAYNVNLAIALSSEEGAAARIVRNDVELGEGGRIFIVTGPNSGGKTTYAQAIGLCQLMAQLGLPVPGTRAALSPVDGLYTHFPIEEKIDRGTGRLGDEAMRIDRIFSSLTGESLVLFNESLSSTNPVEGVYIAKEMLGALCAAGTRAVFTTHLYDLAAAAAEIGEAAGAGEAVVSMVAGSAAEDPSSAYRILPGAPAGNSYAREIARRYGVSFDQLSGKLRERGILG